MSNKERAIKRVSKDIEKFMSSAADYKGIWIEPNEENVLNLKAIIVGPEGTIYEGGFMYFDVTFPDNYPFSPPKVTHLTPAGEKCRLHPNLYGRSGKVCLSILGTWRGEPWVSTMQLATVLITIQGLLDNAPLRHEPGYDKDDSRTNEKIDAFTKATQYNVLHTAVFRMLGRKDVPEELRKRMQIHFNENKGKYMERLHKLASEHGTVRNIHHIYHETKLDYPGLLKQFELL